MFAFLKGNIFHLEAGKVLLEVNGIGYEVFISVNTYEKIKNKKEVFLHTVFIPKEDKHFLIGFAETEEKKVFEKLIKISGVGIQTALRILSGISIDDFFKTLQEGNASSLTKIKGIGKKTAQRIVLELQGSLPKSPGTTDKQEDNLLRDVLNALITLGFSKDEASKKITQIRKQNPELASVEEIIKKALSG